MLGMFRSLSDSTILDGESARSVTDTDIEYDIYLSYRSFYDQSQADLLYRMMITAGLKTWWDCASVPFGESWENKFIEGLANCRVYVCILSRDAIYNTEDSSCNFSSFTRNTLCDNFLLEMTLALELKSRGLIEYIYPILIGDPYKDEYGQVVLGHYYKQGCHPNLIPNIHVLSVLNATTHYLNQLSLGPCVLPMHKLTVKEILNEIVRSKGFIVEGSLASQAVLITKDLMDNYILRSLDPVHHTKKNGKVEEVVDQRH